MNLGERGFYTVDTTNVLYCMFGRVATSYEVTTEAHTNGKDRVDYYTITGERQEM